MSNTPKANDMMPSETPSKTTTTNRSVGHAAGSCSIAIAPMISRISVFALPVPRNFVTCSANYQKPE